MTERPEDRPETRRRTGPLGDDADAQETRRVPTGERADGGEAETRRVTRRNGGDDGEKETRVIRAPGGSGGAYPDTTADATPYPRGYFESAEDREDRLRDMYGGVDWLASFLGFVFSIVAGAIFAAVAGVVLARLGFSLDLAWPIGTAAGTGLAILGVLIFLTYFFGGYVAGRLARFDGGRNGAMLLVWTFLTVIVLALAAGVFSGFLPGGVATALGGVVDGVSSALGGLSQAGIVGIVVVAGALLLALLGGILGGRLGGRYHAEIDGMT